MAGLDPAIQAQLSVMLDARIKSAHDVVEVKSFADEIIPHTQY
jgi:hypothetical protein